MVTPWGCIDFTWLQWLFGEGINYRYELFKNQENRRNFSQHTNVHMCSTFSQIPDAYVDSHYCLPPTLKGRRCRVKWSPTSEVPEEHTLVTEDSMIFQTRSFSLQTRQAHPPSSIWTDSWSSTRAQKRDTQSTLNCEYEKLLNLLMLKPSLPHVSPT